MFLLDSINKLKKTAVWYLRKGLKPNQLSNLFKQGIDILLFKRIVVNYTPTVMGVFINNKCNLKCDFCYFPWEKMCERDMNIEEFKKFLEYDIFKNVIRVSLTGGEPLLHPQFFEFARLASQKGIAVSLVTNGTLLKNYREQLFSSGIDSLMVSHYNEYFSIVQPQIEKIIKERNERKIKLYILLCKVISRENYTIMSQLIDKSIELGVDAINFNHYFPRNQEEAKTKLIYGDNIEITEYINRLKNKYRKAPIDITYPVLIPRETKNIKFCIFLKNMISVDIEGSVAPCCFMVPPDIKYGNIFTQADPFNNDFYLSLREAFKRKDMENIFINNFCRYCYFAYNTPLRVM
ncbi:MAG: radical SAM protein [Candidatus Omnitrophota bacterium]